METSKLYKLIAREIGIRRPRKTQRGFIAKQYIAKQELKTYNRLISLNKIEL